MIFRRANEKNLAGREKTEFYNNKWQRISVDKMASIYANSIYDEQYITTPYNHPKPRFLNSQGQN